jgi:arginyl-tRNA synthetase
MENISKILSLEVNESLNKLEYFKKIDVNQRKLNVQYYGKPNIDYNFCGLIGLSKILDKMSIKKTPKEIFDDVITDLSLRLENDYKIFFDHDNINFVLNNNLLESMIKNMLQKKDIIKKSDNNKKILVDFSSPNIAKDMHVGHLRSTIIGDTICRHFESQGHEVSRINHIGDYGLQFGMLIQYIYKSCPNIEDENIAISDLQKFYTESKKLFDSDEEFKKMAHQRVVELQQGDNNVCKIWNYIKHISRQSYNSIYDRLNINLEEVGESFYQNMIPSIIEELENKGLLIKDNLGRKIIKIPNKKIPLFIVKSNGSYTYDTTDLAAIRYRLINLKMDSIYYVVDVGQSYHFDMIFSVAKLAGWLINQDVRHIGFGVVLKEDGGKFKSRDGDTVKLVDLLDEAIKETSNILANKDTNFTIEEKKTVIENIAYGAIKYADLSCTRTNDYRFSFKRMISLTGNTAVYLLYAYVRISAIIRNAGDYLNMKNIDEKLDSFKITSDHEKKLCKHILHFPDIMDFVNKNLMFHIICKYMYDLSKVFHNFFMKCRCLYYDDNKTTIIKVDYNRLILCETTRRVLAKCFNILNIQTLERM